MITQERVPEIGNLSWIRAYHTGIYGDVSPRLLLEAAAETGLDLTLVDVDELQFFDIQALRQGHVARGKLQPVELTGPVTLPDATGASQTRQMRASVVTHLLAHRSGFLLLRPTIRFDSLTVEGGLTAAALHKLERGVWAMASQLEWHLPGVAEPMSGYVRNYMNRVFLDLFARWSGDRVKPSQLTAWAVEGRHGCERLHQMASDGLLEHAFPVSFGTEIQLVLPRQPDELAAEWNARVDALAWDIMRPPGAVVDTPPRDVEADARTVAWFVDESVSLLVRAEGGFDDTLDVVDVDRSQVTEYLALRRGVLASVQRSTQRVITERATISRQQLARWQYLVATLTDDYVLHARAGCLLEPLKLHFVHEPRLRDVNDLERQVRSNLDWFHARIEASAEWTGGLVGAAVGAAALALSLAEPVRIVIGRVTNTPVESVADTYGLGLAGAIVAVVLLSFVASFALVRHLSSNLRPLSRRRKVRLVVRRQRPRRARQALAAPGTAEAIAPRSPANVE